MTKPTRRPLTIRIAFGLLWLFVFTLPLTHATEIPRIGIISSLAGFAAMTAGVVAVMARRQVRLLAPVHLAMSALVLWSAVTLCWSITPDLTVQRTTTYLQLFVLVLLVWEFCQEEKDLLQILSSFVLGTIIPSLLTLLAFLPGQQTLIQRASVPGFDANALAFLLALSLPVSYYLILSDRSPASALYRLQMTFAVCVILLTGSAITMIAMAIGLSLVCWTAHVIPVRTRAKAFAILLLLAGSAALLLPASLWQHLADASKSGAVTVTAVANSSLEPVRSAPLGGFGAGTLPAAVVNSPAKPNLSFPMFAEMGVVGMICFAAMLGILLLSAGRMSGISKSFWCTVLGVWTAGACGLTWECLQPAWLLFGLLAAHSACMKQEGLTRLKKEQKQNYCVEQAQVCS